MPFVNGEFKSDNLLRIRVEFDVEHVNCNDILQRFKEWKWIPQHLTQDQNAFVKTNVLKTVADDKKVIAENGFVTLLYDTSTEIYGMFSLVIETLKPLFPDRNLNPERIRMSVISYWLNDKKFPVKQVMDLSGQKWPSTVMQYKKINVEEQRELINKFHPLS